MVLKITSTLSMADERVSAFVVSMQVSREESTRQLVSMQHLDMSLGYGVTLMNLVVKDCIANLIVSLTDPPSHKFVKIEIFTNEKENADNSPFYNVINENM